MINKTELMDKMKKQGINVETLAKCVGVSCSTMYRILSGEGKGFTVKQVCIIKDVLHLSNKEVVAIFFVGYSQK